VLPDDFRRDTSAYFFDRLTDPVLPCYARLSTGLIWPWNRKLSFESGGLSLLKACQEGYIDSAGSAGTTAIKPCAHAKFTWQF
jgi:hypothetical protein